MAKKTSTTKALTKASTRSPMTTRKNTVLVQKENKPVVTQKKQSITQKEKKSATIQKEVSALQKGNSSAVVPKKESTVQKGNSSAVVPKKESTVQKENNSASTQKKVSRATKASKSKATSALKKRAAKKRVTKKKVFVKAPEDKLFVLFTGERLSHFIELADKLEHIPEEVFLHHVREEKNDFAKWIQDVFDEPELAKQIASKKNPKDMQISIYKYVIKKHLQ